MPATNYTNGTIGEVNVSLMVSAPSTGMDAVKSSPVETCGHVPRLGTLIGGAVQSKADQDHLAVNVHPPCSWIVKSYISIYYKVAEVLGWQIYPRGSR